MLGRIRTNNGIERINREIRRWTRVVGTFPDGNSALMLVTARLGSVEKVGVRALAAPVSDIRNQLIS